MSKHLCPRCNGHGMDPRKEDQSCLVCWGVGTIDLHDEYWNGQYRKLAEHILTHPNWERVRDELWGSPRSRRFLDEHQEDVPTSFPPIVPQQAPVQGEDMTRPKRLP